MLYESYGPRKKGRAARLARLSIYLLIAAALAVAYFYGPDLYYRFLGDSLFRLQESNRKLGRQIQEQRLQADVLLKKISENRRIADILHKNSPANTDILFQKVLLDYLELVLRMRPDSRNLLQLTGRGYLPTLQRIAGSKGSPTSTRLALRVAKGLRRILAIQPDFRQLSEIEMMLVFADFIYSGRLDKNLLERLDRLELKKMPPYLRGSSEWELLALYTLSAKLPRQQALIRELRIDPEGKNQTDTKDAKGQPKYHLRLNPVEAELLRCHGLYYAKSYFRAWQIARRLKSDPKIALDDRVEATLSLIHI